MREGLFKLSNTIDLGEPSSGSQSSRRDFYRKDFERRRQETKENLLEYQEQAERIVEYLDQHGNELKEAIQRLEQKDPVFEIARRNFLKYHIDNIESAEHEMQTTAKLERGEARNLFSRMVSDGGAIVSDIDYTLIDSAQRDKVMTIPKDFIEFCREAYEQKYSNCNCHG